MATWREHNGEGEWPHGRNTMVRVSGLHGRNTMVRVSGLHGGNTMVRVSGLHGGNTMVRVSGLHGGNTMVRVSGHMAGTDSRSNFVLRRITRKEKQEEHKSKDVCPCLCVLDETIS